MSVVTTKYVRKPLFVDAVQITLANFNEVAEWCQGEVRDYHDKPLAPEQATNEALERYIHVRVHNPKNVRQTKAFVGDWLLYTERGYKVYTQKAFRASFDAVPQDQDSEATTDQDENPSQAA